MSKRAPKRSKGSSAAGWIGYGLFLLIILLAGAGFGWAGKSRHFMSMIGAATGLGAPKKPTEVFDKDTLNILVLGCDEDLAPGGKKVLLKNARSDMMLVAHLDFKGKKITGVSIPRDTLCQVEGFREQKINGYHALGMKKGEEAASALTKEAVQTLLPGVIIDRVIVLDYDAFQSLVNYVGGVPIFVDKKMDYDDNAGNLHIHFKPGKQTLDGYHAMGFVRFRHSDSDFKRQERQKQFLLAFRDRVKQDPLKLPGVIEESVKVLGSALNDQELDSLVAFAMKIGSDNIKMGVVPTVEAKGRRDWALRVDEDKLDDTLREFNLVGGSQVASRR